MIFFPSKNRSMSITKEMYGLKENKCYQECLD